MDLLRLGDLDRIEMWQDDTDMRAKVAFPFTPTFPANAGVEADNLTVVCTVVEPGDAVGTHTESVEEILLVLEGRADVRVGDETAEVASGQMVRIPAKVPHRIRNAGEGPLRFVGFFPSGDVTSRFEEPLMPPGETEFRTVER